MLRFKQFIAEDLKIAINVGDYVLGGKFKNKKIKIKSITRNEKGDWLINGKPALKFRVVDAATQKKLQEK